MLSVLRMWEERERDPHLLSVCKFPSSPASWCKHCSALPPGCGQLATSWQTVLRMAQGDGPTDPCAQSAPALSPKSAAGLQSETLGVVDSSCSVWGCWWHTSCSHHPAAARALPRACSCGCAGREHWTHSGPAHVSLCWSADSIPPCPCNFWSEKPLHREAA